MVAKKIDDTQPSKRLPNGYLGTALEMLEKRGEAYWMNAVGGSMRPLIQEGDSLQIDPTANSPKQGDIVAFRRGEQLTAHRVLQVAQDTEGKQMILARGDHALKSDPAIQADHIIGKVIAIQRGDQVMRVDTPAWQSAGRLLAGLLLRWNANQPNQRNKASWLDQVIRKALGGFIWFLQALLSHWEDVER